MDFGLKTLHVNKVAELLKSQVEWFVRSFCARIWFEFST